MGSAEGWLCRNSAFFAKTYPPHAAVPTNKIKNKMSAQRGDDFVVSGALMYLEVLNEA